MSTMTEKERREAERQKRLRAASREFEKKLGLPEDPNRFKPRSPVEDRNADVESVEPCDRGLIEFREREEDW